MSSASTKTPQRKENEESIELQNDTSAELREDAKKDNGKESENEKPQSPEVRINMDESQEHTKTGFSNKKILLYECQSLPEPRKKVPTTLVYLGRIENQVDPTGAPLQYSSDRNRFVRLVMILVFIMFATTTVCLIMVHCIESLNEFCSDLGMGLFFIGLAMVLFMTYAINCSPCTRLFPYNFICLFVSVIGLTFICAFLTVILSDLVLLAVAATAGVVLVFCLLSLTKFDFTKDILYLVVISAAFFNVLAIFMIYGFVTGHHMNWLPFTLMAVSSMYSSLVVTIELQLILLQKAAELSEEDYAAGAFMVYISIIGICIKSSIRWALRGSESDSQNQIQNESESD